MFERLEEIEQRYEELAEKLADPTVWSDQKEYQRLAKAHSDLTEFVTKFRDYKRVHQEKLDTEEILKDHLDEEMRELAQSELETLKERESRLEEQLRIMLLPKDRNDEKSVLIEIRAGTGGEEAALFAGELFRMYSRYAERRNWKTELMSVNETGIGGIKEAILAIDGRSAYSNLKFESGVHRVQRVPETESGGRIHTSAATVAVMPEAEEVEVEIDPDDLEIDTYRSSSAGGQNVQKNETAIRITHTPSGIVVTCQDERSQFQNKEKAMRMLRAHLLEKMIAEQQDQISETRRSMVKSGDRSDKIRTYNFPQGRITDHRIGFSLHNLNSFMDGDIQEMLDHLISADQSEQLKTKEEAG
ncbi:MAG TPA: peptide chain release factor 1 [Armatimonadota bacterium]|nr:peptide chain release factor 1 [Armatimonadota bacterium]